MKIAIFLIVAVILGGGGWWGYTVFLKRPAPAVSTGSMQAGGGMLSPAVRSVLNQKTILLEELVSDGVFVRAVEAAGAANAKLSQSDIKRLDTQWQSASAGDLFISGFMTNSLAKILVDFQESNPGFVELFVTDKVGLNVAQTNKTSDYYQADEDWWVEAYSNGRGRAYHGEIEFDESARSDSIALYVPVYSASRQVIGVLKGVLDLTALSRELQK